MRGWLWLHFIADAGMFAQALRSGSLANMIGDRRAFRDAFLTTRELLPILEARGVDLRRHRSAMLPFRLPRLVATASAMGDRAAPDGSKEPRSAHRSPHRRVARRARGHAARSATAQYLHPAPRALNRSPRRSSDRKFPAPRSTPPPAT